MKFRSLWFFYLRFLSLAALLTMPAIAQVGVSTNERPAALRSFFIQPSTANEGRDPFFPGSIRPYAKTVVPTAPTKDLSSLILRGVSGPPDHRLAIINSVTFGVGDEADVFTPKGRIRIQCLEITENSALIETSGQRQMLYYTAKP